MTTTITKTCTKCGIEKSSDNFTKDIKNKDGLKSWCKECSKINSKKYRDLHSKKYETIISNRWSSINQRCVNGCYKTPNAPQFQSYTKKGITVDMTKEQFTTWMLSVEDIHNEIVSKGERSSIDRIDEAKGYEIGNLQLISLHANIEKRSGKTCRYLTTEEKPKKKIVNRSRYLKFKTDGLTNEI